MSSLRKLQRRTDMIVVSLPKWWLKQRGIKAGEYVEVSTHNNHLRIIPRQDKTIPLYRKSMRKNSKGTCKI